MTTATRTNGGTGRPSTRSRDAAERRRLAAEQRRARHPAHSPGVRSYLVDPTEPAARGARDADLSRLITRLGFAVSRLDLARNYWRSTEHIESEDHGAVAVVHDVGREIVELYTALNEWADERGFLVKGPVSFLQDNEPLECAPGKGEDD